MRIKRKIYTAAVIAAALASLSAMTVMASSKEKITTVRLELKDSLTRGGAIDSDELEFESSSDEYNIAEWEIENDGLVWTDSDVPKVTVTLETEDDYSFSVSKDKIKVKGDEAKVSSTHRENSQSLEITFELKPMSERVGPVEYAYLKDSIAAWGPADGAASYDIYLYRDSKVVGSKKNTTETTYDFGTAMLKAGAYYYRVRGVGADGTAEGLLTDSEEFVRSSNGGSTGTGNGSQTAQAGSWQTNETGKWWQRADGTWPYSQWELINNQWFFFNDTGYMVTGWVDWNGKRYYLGPEGDMWVNRQTPDGFTLNSSGEMINQ